MVPRDVPRGIYASLPGVIYAGYSQGVSLLPCVVVTIAQYVHYLVDGCALLAAEMRERGLCAEEKPPSHLRIFLSSQEKQAYLDQQTRYRKHPCTRNVRIS